MKKLLPINFEPYIRTYTHHGFHHSVISTSDKVAYKENEIIASIQIKNFSEYIWSSQIDALHYDIIENDRLNFYGNKWNINMNAAFWRTCSSTESIEIKINNQLYSNVWASIYVFLSNDPQISMTNFDEAYNLVFGNCSKDGIYYRDRHLFHTVLCSSPIFPVTICLKKTEKKVILIYKDADLTVNELTLDINNIIDSSDRIGFGINLRCNSYYEWLFSNYINVYVDLNNGLPIDYLCDIHKDWCCHTYNHFIDFNIETEKDLESTGFSLIDYIKKMIDIDRYIEILINDSIHLRNNNTVLFHQNLIYGYDDTENCFYLLYYNNGKVIPTTMSYVDFLSDRNHLDNRKVYIYKYNPAYEHYRISPQHLLQVFKEFRDSENITHYETQHDNQVYFGIDGIKSLLSESGQKILLSDIRASYLLYERCKCNHDRIDYLYCRGFLYLSDYEKIRSLTKKGCNLTLTINNLVLKKRYGGKVNDNAIINYFKEYINIECELTDKIITAIEKYLTT